MQALWEIGAGDSGPSGLALWPDNLLGFNSRFPLDPLFIVGASDPTLDWPFFQPGPMDEFAGARAHTFSILFGLAERPEEGICRVTVDLFDSHRSLPPVLRIRLNDHEQEFVTAAGSADWLEGRSPAGRPSRIIMTVPAASLVGGRNRVSISSVSGCWLVYSHLAFEAPEGTRLAPVEAATEVLSGHSRQVLWAGDDGRLRQGARVFVRHTGRTTEADVRVGGGVTTKVELRPGNQQVDVDAPGTSETGSAKAVVEIGGKAVASGELKLDPVRRWVVYLLHHTHLDIGYTHFQTEVQELQWRHLERAVELGRDTRDYPEGARFKWNPEGLWVVDTYLDQATPEKRDALIEAVHSGSIGLDGLYSNTLTALCRPEELFELLGTARRLREGHSVSIDSAMISDIPGYTWGLVPALAQSGIKYLSIGPNRSHRIGYTLAEWGDRPFYWVSPSGEERILCWMAGKGYSWFHGPWKAAETFNYSDVKSPIDAGRIVDYLANLAKQDYPYDLVQLRYNIGSDNGPPDPGLADFVREWNKRHIAPRLAISTTSEMMRALEERYGPKLPVVRGDFTPYWEDGAASTALETSMNRASGERLVQAQVLWSMLDPRGFPVREFDIAWRNVLLFSEHTWGSWNSISDPDSEFSAAQWKKKQSFAVEADRRSRALVSGALKTISSDGKRVAAVAVFNTASWPRTDLVILPKDWDLAGSLVKDGKGEPVPSQRLHRGELAFLARELPPLRATTFTLHDGAPHRVGEALAARNSLSNGRFRLCVDERTGAIHSWTGEGVSGDLVNTEKGMGLNDYLYVAGRDPRRPQRVESVTIRVKEQGPLVASLVIDSPAPGCHSLSREVVLIAGLDRVDIVDVIDKQLNYDKEGVHVAFPFHIPNGVVRMDVPWGVVRPDADQLPGANRNYFTIGRWVDVSNESAGITWASVDAPLLEIGDIATDAVVVGWRTSTPVSTTLYSYIMNNYWETNYKAGQEGRATFRYSIQPHGPFDSAGATRFGMERSQPLLVAPVREAFAGGDSLFSVQPADVIVTSAKPGRDGKSLIVRLFNATDHAQSAEIVRRGGPWRVTWMSDLSEQRTSKVEGPVSIPPWGIRTLRCEAE